MIIFICMKINLFDNYKIRLKIDKGYFYMKKNIIDLFCWSNPSQIFLYF